MKLSVLGSVNKFASFSCLCFLTDKSVLIKYKLYVYRIENENLFSLFLPSNKMSSIFLKSEAKIFV